MGREVRRVPLDFDWPIDEIWQGYLMPESLREDTCETCGGDGYSPEARELKEKWYSNGRFRPSETGSTPLTAETPEVRAFAERNVESAPEFYGRGEAAIFREAWRLASLWNGAWSHHLDQDDVDALIAEGRLRDFTHTWDRDERCWKPIEGAVATAEAVNRWSLSGLGHDSINCWIAVRAKCERLGVPHGCPACDGHGSTEAYPGQRADADAWERTDPPTGEGWQLWSTTTEGNPLTPVFETPEALADYCVEARVSWFGHSPAPRDKWLRMFLGEMYVGAVVGPGAVII